MLDAGDNFQASGRSLVLLSALHDGAVWTTAEPARARLSMPEVVILPEAMEQEAPEEASTGAEAAAVDPAVHGDTGVEASGEGASGEEAAVPEGERREAEPSETQTR